MLRVSLLFSMIFLTACSHYQHLNQSTAQTDNDNRYSQSNIVITHTNKKSRVVNNTESPSIKSASETPIPASEPVITPPIIQPKQPEKLEQNSIIWQHLVSLFSIENIKPWQKSILAKDTMKPGGSTPGSEKFNQKIYLSKESSRGGLGVAGGGCGCN